MPNVARDVIWPTNTSIVVRVVVLNVGQGNSAVVLVRSGESYQTLLVDINLHTDLGIDVPALMTDLVGDTGLDVFINTHPHNDHLCGVTELSDAVEIREVWHSGHVPGKKDRDAYDNLQKVIQKVTKAYGEQAEVELLGSKSPTAMGDAGYYVLSPAKHVVEDIAGETEDERRKRIHEHCAVLKFGIPETWIMLPGDADRDAWELHITEYHKDRIGAAILAAAHHGSRSFFKKDEDDPDPYLDGLKGIDPKHVIISAPTPENSRHEHPHEDAVALYADHVTKDELYHTGKDGHSFVCDVFENGTYGLVSDDGKLFKAYPYTGDGNDEGSGSGKQAVSIQESRPGVPPARPFA